MNFPNHDVGTRSQLPGPSSVGATPNRPSRDSEPTCSKPGELHVHLDNRDEHFNRSKVGSILEHINQKLDVVVERYAGLVRISRQGASAGGRTLRRNVVSRQAPLGSAQVKPKRPENRDSRGGRQCSLALRSPMKHHTQVVLLRAASRLSRLARIIRVSPTQPPVSKNSMRLPAAPIAAGLPWNERGMMPVDNLLGSGACPTR